MKFKVETDTETFSVVADIVKYDDGVLSLFNETQQFEQMSTFPRGVNPESLVSIREDLVGVINGCINFYIADE